MVISSENVAHPYTSIIGAKRFAKLEKRESKSQTTEFSLS